MMPFNIVIPARYGSTRLTGKPLLNIAGKPMIAHVCERAKEANPQEIVVATDDERIFDVVSNLGFNAVMTDENHASGTERVNEVANKLGWNSETIVVNLQGDEPLLPAFYIHQVAHALAQQTQANIATLATKIDDSQDVFNPNVVKVVLNENNYALYFSRAPIPWNRASFADEKNLPDAFSYLRHIGLYAYRVKFLNAYCQWQNSAIEEIEALEQLRILWHGESILVDITDKTPPAGVDTLDDLNRVERIFQQNSLF